MSFSNHIGSGASVVFIIICNLYAYIFIVLGDNSIKKHYVAGPLIEWEKWLFLYLNPFMEIRGTDALLYWCNDAGSSS